MAKPPVKVSEIELRLQGNGLSDEKVKDIAGQLAGLQGGEARLDDIFQLGIIHPEINATFRVPPADLEKFVQDVVKLKNPRPSFEVFPLGIPANPDMFSVKVKTNLGGG